MFFFVLFDALLLTRGQSCMLTSLEVGRAMLLHLAPCISSPTPYAGKKLEGSCVNCTGMLSKGSGVRAGRSASASRDWRPW